jgi:preprotein translocase subunit Sss1
MSSEIQQYIEDIKQFAKESEMFIVRCEKPDRKRTTIIYTRVPEDRLVLRNWIWSYGRPIGYVIKLLFIPINNIILS